MINFLKRLFKPNYESLGGAAFKARYKAASGAALLDVRSAAEFKSGTISGAKNIDVMSASFQQHIARLDKSKEYFVFCRSGARSSSACRMMSAQGFKVVNLSGGIGAWKNH